MSREDLQRRRAERARNGSNRVRDIEAAREQGEDERRIAQARRRERLVRDTKQTTRADEVWEKALRLLADSLPQSTFVLWIQPLRLIGEVNDSLHLQSPPGNLAWVERRYGALLGDAARNAGEGCRGVYITIDEDPGGRYRDEDGLL